MDSNHTSEIEAWTPLRQPGPADRHPALVYLTQLGAGSRRTMRQALNTIAAILSADQCDATTLAWEMLRYQHTAALRAALAERYRPATANKILSALRGVLREARRLGLLAGDDYTLAADLPSIKGETVPQGRALSLGELSALMEVCSQDTTPAGARDAALIAILGRAGLRRSEVVALDIDDYDPESGALAVRHAKGQKQRMTYVSGGADAALKDWLAVRGALAGPLLCPVNKAGTIIIRRMSDQAVLWALRKRIDQAGMRSFSPHDLRRTFISDLLDAGVDIATVQRLVGHASPSTTSTYDRRGEAAKRKATALLHLPYRTRGTPDRAAAITSEAPEKSL